MTGAGASGDVDELELFREYHRTRDRGLRNSLVERHMGFAIHVSRRYEPRSREPDDVRQAAMYGLVKAVDRFDPGYGTAFTTFAGTTIEGEIKRHFRDATWAIRVPRRAKELHLLVRGAVEVLGARLGRRPTIDEIAHHLEVDREDVVRGLSATSAREVRALDASTSGDGADGDPDRLVPLAVDEPGFERGIDRQLAMEAMVVLDDRERRIVELRFFDEMTQREIADEVGLSQMHVSRLLRRSFQRMRAHLELTASERSEAAVRPDD